MKLINKTYYIKFVVFCTVISTIYLSACKKYIEVPPPKMSVEAGELFRDSSATLSSVLHLYTETPEIIGVFASLSADEVLMPLSGIMGSIIGAGNVQSNKLNALIDGYPVGQNIGAAVYTPLYHKINTANICIDGITKSSAYGTAFKNQLIGECKFWRAWSYFYLANLFGNVPLNLSPDLNANKVLTNTPVTEIYRQIIADLTDARNLLSSTNMSTEKIRVNKAAVTALLARVYFYQQNWAAAHTESNTLLTSGTYTLEPDAANVFLKTSRETIFQVQTYGNTPNITGVTLTPSFYLPLSGVLMNSHFNPNLLSSFQAGDLRRTKWAASFMDFTTFQTFTYPAKYKHTNQTVSGNEYIVMFRLAEQYLIRAEAAAHLGRLSDAESDLHVVRSRAGLSTRVALPDMQTALSALEHERRIELFSEWGDRWLNLKRTNRIHTVLPITKASSVPNYKWEPYQALYPLPTQEIFANRNITQNPGY
ncbi:MAG: RagB/SusD family nutrient uptake outer membrane protein [Pedobacter sp.]|nr:MAG: RagB/SusD family nutrient uptake outer membrane protein [Pedobacter sp.]